MKKIVTVMAFLGLMAFSGSALAEPTVQSILNGITLGPTPGASSVNVDTEKLLDDQYWSIAGSGGSLATMIIEVAGLANFNSFGLFDMNDPSKKVQVFAGIAGAGAQKVVSIHDDGSVFVNFVDKGIDFSGNNFGFYFKNPLGTFYSDTGLNGDGYDHLWAFQGEGDLIKLPGLAPGIWTPNEFALAWEDTMGGGDGDHNDMVLMVESVTPKKVPEPGALLLLGSGMVGIALFRRRRA